MHSKCFLTVASSAFLSLAPIAANCGTDAPPNASSLTPQAITKIVPGQSTKAEIKSLLGEPWRVVQFNDCGEPMDDQGDETWEYRGIAANGPYRLHIEFGDQGTVHLLATIPDKTLGGKSTSAKVAPGGPSHSMSM
jgi:hypothetical protein